MKALILVDLMPFVWIKNPNELNKKSTALAPNRKLILNPDERSNFIKIKMRILAKIKNPITGTNFLRRD
jgi:hypothetical protein